MSLGRPNGWGADPLGTNSPKPEVAREWLAAMVLIRRFEERAGEMYARAKIGGFLHLSIGEEATIVGSERALRDSDYLVSTYRSHGDALARGTPPEKVMAELFGKRDGCSKGHGGSMHMFDASRRFMGGYGIVGGNLPIAAGIALACDQRRGPAKAGETGTTRGETGSARTGEGETGSARTGEGETNDEVTLCTFGDGASNQGTFGETLNLAALWRLPIVFMVVNNQFGMGTSLSRHSAVTDLQRKGESLGVPGMRCDGMDILDTHRVVSEAVARVREERRPLLVEAVTYRFRGHSMADPEDYRSKEEVAEWRERDPIPAFSELLEREGALTKAQREQIERDAMRQVDAAVEFAESSPFPDPDMLYEDVYVLDEQVHGHYHWSPRVVL
ncbi:MAG TPA: pyruvate dehydrogenase (acetyl-transferring) E1 component subunit alpha [Solirubrobacteraceae bacterium]|jgi:pyruvate dehydrogenase E1 component alpha subunit|nr:pyruvate dehydrogenase (acetyl-transferring) E1 component subunit alpha [Solirubrobacteraceae bacterium]